MLKPYRHSILGLLVCALALGIGARLGHAQGTGTDALLPPAPPFPVINQPTPDSARAAANTAPRPTPSVFMDDDPNAIRVLLSPKLETALSAEIVGQIATLNAHLGARVSQGDLLLEFDCAETQARLRMALAEAASARETLQIKQRLRKLDAAGQSEVTLALLELEKSEAAIAVTQAQLKHCQITAPFNARIVKVHVKPHQSVSVGAPLLELVSEGPLKLRMNVPSRLLKNLQIGSPVDVHIIETGHQYAAKVSAMNARVDAVSQTIELEALLNEPAAELLPGMSGVARFAQ